MREDIYPYRSFTEKWFHEAVSNFESLERNCVDCRLENSRSIETDSSHRDQLAWRQLTDI